MVSRNTKQIDPAQHLTTTDWVLGHLQYSYYRYIMIYSINSYYRYIMVDL